MNVLDEPAVILICATVAAVLVLIEVALPTLGLAGTGATAVTVAAILGVDRREATWWPLIGVAVPVVLWSILVLSRRRSRPAEMVAVAGYAAGGVGFALTNDDVLALVVAIIGAVALAAAFPPLHQGASRLLGARSSVGMESFVGQTARVDRWHGGTGVVLLQGTRWNATAARPVSLGEGDEVTVVGSHGNTIEIATGGGVLHPPEPPSPASFPPPAAQPGRPQTAPPRNASQTQGATQTQNASRKEMS